MLNNTRKRDTSTLSTRQGEMVMIAILALAGVFFALISLVNHYLFKTYTLDLGLFTHAMYEYAHFRAADCSMFMDSQASLLSDHFDLYLIILSPLVYVFGSYTLLIVQIAAVLLGGWGVYKLIGLYTGDRLMPLMASASFFFSFGIIHALAFDYHSNVLAAMMLPWLLYFLKQGHYKLASLFVMLFVIGKENMSLWLFFIAVGLMWDYRKDKKALFHLTGYAVFSIAYFFIINMIVMPNLGGSGGGFSRYSYLGDNYAEIGKTLITHPGLTLKLLFTSTIGLESFAGLEANLNETVINTILNPKYAGIKEEFYWCALSTGLILTILKPNYLFMILPLIGQKMIACQPNFWGISFQYSVEFMPVLVISSFIVIVKLKRRFWRVILAAVLFISVILTTFYTIGVPRSKVFLDQLCVYQDRHYRQDNFDAEYARKLLKMIPGEASVCASDMFTPHLSLRSQVFSYQNRGASTGADYYLVSLYREWMCTWDDVEALYKLMDYELLATDGYLFLFRKRPEP